MARAQALLQTAGFDPRSREGATGTSDTLIASILVSIHAPVRERPVTQQAIAQRLKFRSTLP